METLVISVPVDAETAQAYLKEYVASIIVSWTMYSEPLVKALPQVA